MITPQDLVQANLYPNQQAVIDDAIQLLWRERPLLRLDWAIYQYRTQEISLAKAAMLAGVSFDRMKELLLQRGIQPRLGSETVSEAKAELNIIRQSLQNNPHLNLPTQELMWLK